MRLTVITICRNAVKTLRRTVESVLAQTRLPDEYLFVDGHSEDGTPALLEELCASLQARGVSAHWQAQQALSPGMAGIPTAWNQGIQASTGDIIALLNGDDWYEPETLAMVERLAQEHPEAGALAFSVRFIHPGNDGMTQVFTPHHLGELPWRMPMPHPGFFVRKCVYEQIGLYDVGYHISADYDLIWRCHERQIPILRQNQVATNMELGGLANSSRKLARTETRTIALKYAGREPKTGKRLAMTAVIWLAWLARCLTGR